MVDPLKLGRKSEVSYTSGEKRQGKSSLSLANILGDRSSTAQLPTYCISNMVGMTRGGDEVSSGGGDSGVKAVKLVGGGRLQ